MQLQARYIPAIKCQHHHSLARRVTERTADAGRVVVTTALAATTGVGALVIAGAGTAASAELARAREIESQVVVNMVK